MVMVAAGFHFVAVSELVFLLVLVVAFPLLQLLFGFVFDVVVAVAAVVALVLVLVVGFLLCPFLQLVVEVVASAVVFRQLVP